MPRYICHHDGLFFEWSTIVDAPVTEAMSREDFVAYYREEYGCSSMEALPARLDRAVAHGTSSFQGETLEALTADNRAGPGGTYMPLPALLASISPSP